MPSNLVKGIVFGAIITKIAYLIPVLNIIAPIFGGAVAAYVYSSGALGGMKAGFLKGILMGLPAIILGTVFASLLADIPVIGDLLAGSLGLFVLIIVIHSVTIGMVGGFIGGALAGNSQPTDQKAMTGSTGGTSTQLDPSPAGTGQGKPHRAGEQSPTTSVQKSTTPERREKAPERRQDTAEDRRQERTSPPEPAHQEPQGGRRAPERNAQAAEESREPPQRTCQNCGEEAPSAGRIYCNTCGAELPESAH
jgi:hypothetical protein